MLLGGTYGAAIGAIGDASASEAATSLLEVVTDKLTDGSVAIVVLVNEEKEADQDAVLAKFDAIVLRRDMAFVAEEVAEAQRLEAEIQHQVREQWKADKKKELAAKGQEFQASVKQKIDKAKADFDAFMAAYVRGSMNVGS